VIMTDRRRSRTAWAVGGAIPPAYRPDPDRFPGVLTNEMRTTSESSLSIEMTMSRPLPLARKRTDVRRMVHSERPLPEPPPAQVDGRALLRFLAIHLVFLAACFGVGETVFRLSSHSSVYEIGPGNEFPNLDAAEVALAVEIGRAWVAVGLFSSLVVLAVWLRKRAFRWFWVPLACVPYLGPIFFAGPATWAVANGTTRSARNRL
jgi:hypothetical protein